jgi:MFS family permease
LGELARIQPGPFQAKALGRREGKVSLNDTKATGAGPPPGGTAAEAVAKRPSVRLDPAEWRAVWSLATIYATRMLGLFLLLPVMALYAGGLPGATPWLAGLAVGAYGLTQAVLQIPFGSASDRYGRRPVITAGLVLYALGSVLGAVAGSIWAVIAARMVQGAGAVTGPISALLADLTRNEVRTRAMAVIGISIGLSFVVSLVGAPLLHGAIGVQGIFWLMAGLAVLGVLLLWLVVPPGGDLHPREASPPATGAADDRAASARDTTHTAGASEAVPDGGAWARELWPYYAGMFVLQFTLTATFVGVPHALRDVLGIALDDHWATYLGVFVASIAGTVVLVLWSERSGRPAFVLRVGVAGLVFSLGALAFLYPGYWGLAAALTIYFTAFNFLEARLPAGLSQAAGPRTRGAALGVFATSQFLGAFAGGVAGGALNGSSMGLAGVFGGAALVALAWLLAFRRTGTV